NPDFLDHYLDVRFDLSKVLFVCTANQLDTIPGPLLDRMEVIRLSGYITAEKVRIARRHLWPKHLEKAGLGRGDITISDSAIRRVIEGYAREAGVRGLDKQLGRLVRKAIVERLKEGGTRRMRIGPEEIRRYLGPPTFRRERPITGVGVVTGLAWTPLGGATLSIEASRVHSGGRGFRFTGQLGDVMKESAEIAYSYVAGNLAELGAEPGALDTLHVHLHVPEGATKKDGPSAGITMATALLSLARNERIRRPLAMTGELTVTGHVLAVGGIREKIVAASRAGIREIILPAENRPDFEKLPDYLRTGLKVHFVERYPEVAQIVFGHAGKKKKAGNR